MFYVYLLQSSKYPEQLYVGSTGNIEERLRRHNNGKEFSTKRYRPWKLIYYEAYSSEKLARIREKRLKYHGNALRQLKQRSMPDRKNNSVLRNGAGFTLVELIVAIGVLAIFASTVVAVLNPFEQFKKASDSQRKNDLAQIQRALEAYYQDFGRYPDDSISGSKVYKLVVSVSGVPTALEWGSSFAPYMDVLPADPGGSRTYIYVVASDGQSYWLYASVERGGKDPQACNPQGTACPNVPVGVTCGSGVCNYGVSSPNVSP